MIPEWFPLVTVAQQSGLVGIPRRQSMQHGDIITSFQAAITGEHPIMKLKAFGIGAALAAVVLTGSVGFAQHAAATCETRKLPRGRI